MPARINIIGQRFGRLIVVADAGHQIVGVGRSVRISLCRCDCGNTVKSINSNLTKGQTQSCGCYRAEVLRAANVIHGHTFSGKSSKIYNTRHKMISRCTKPSDKRYGDYGGSGIKVCDRWLNSFPDFLSDMGEGKKGWSIERVNNDGNYDPLNCVWATAVHQARNRSSNRIMTVRGVTGCFTELVEKFGCNYSRVISRLNLGWDSERAFFEPKHSS